MPIYRHQVTYECITGLPEDRFINVLHSNSADDADAVDFATDFVATFGTVQTGQTHGATEYLGPAVSRAVDAGHVEIYDLSDPEPRVAVASVPFTVLANTGSDVPLPRETSICLSFQANPMSGVPQARRRGRIFFGPLALVACSSDTATGDQQPAEVFLDDLEIALTEFLALRNGEWVVYSRVLGTGAVVSNGWIDDALDTQRRRGQRPASRRLW
jgi:hypothetical protein